MPSYIYYFHFFFSCVVKDEIPKVENRRVRVVRVPKKKKKQPKCKKRDSQTVNCFRKHITLLCWRRNIIWNQRQQTKTQYTVINNIEMSISNINSNNNFKKWTETIGNAERETKIKHQTIFHHNYPLYIVMFNRMWKWKSLLLIFMLMLYVGWYCCWLPVCFCCGCCCCCLLRCCLCRNKLFSFGFLAFASFMFQFLC